MDEYKTRSLSVEICSDGIVYIAEADSSGCEYKWETKEDIIAAVRSYVNNYIDLATCFDEVE